MFGGIVTTSGGMMNDLWMYCVATNSWTWKGGNNIPDPTGNWGTKGVSSPTNRPNGRMGALAWTDYNGNLYIFGGSSNPFATVYNDLWKFTIDPGCGTTCGASVCSPPPVPALASSDSSICTNDCISFNDLSTNNPTNWLWSFAGGLLHGTGLPVHRRPHTELD